MYGAEIEISEMAHDQKAPPFNPTDRPGIKVEETEEHREERGEGERELIYAWNGGGIKFPIRTSSSSLIFLSVPFSALCALY